jgi:hypothetical protein
MGNAPRRRIHFGQGDGRRDGREFSYGTRKSLHVCNAAKADAKLGPGSLSRRLMAIIAMSLQFGHYGLRRKTNWWDNFKKA